MRILHFYRTYYPDSYGGIEQVIYQIASGSSALGVETEVLSLTRDNSDRTVKVGNHLAHRTRLDFQIASTGFSLSAFIRFSQLAKRADIIHYHYPWPFMDMVHFATKVNKPTVVTYHSDIIRQKFLLRAYQPLMDCFLRSVDRIVATSPNYFQTSEVLNRFRDKTEVIPIGLDKASYPAPSADTLEKWRQRVGEKFFLFVGMIRYYKGLHILMDALQGTDYPVVIVGSGPMEAALKEQAKNLGLGNVHFLGALPDDDKVALLKLCYAVAFPSHVRSEAFGVSLLEGAMFGKPMISCEIGTGTSYINVNGETGIVVPPNDPTAFREAMCSLWDNPSLASDLGHRAEARYWELFTADKMAASYVSLYQRLLSGPLGGEA
ncbi:N-acetyl-alpha-D-glucosaminyl-diphospho-ditrans, octacis-undecaprenol 3-alpha-mannosyltransferase / rhamnosyltransferase [Methylococcales bacterium]|nr:N-acetyl-alpha-D-glucosaminyl-diphospho-ditrans, octacis-undecaprenol 3-alpha-mannosyltransferase / rhamnosyltransferase [Methylococcales bacterium]